MEGMARAATRNVDLAVLTAWHTAIFGLLGYAGKLRGKKLADFLTAKAEPAPAGHAATLAFFHALKARGLAVEITRH
jgi:hypothetical protein